jgi:hypothetical protein
MTTQRHKALSGSAAAAPDAAYKIEKTRLWLQIVQTSAGMISMVAIVIAYYQFEEGQRREEQSVYQTISTDWNGHLRLFVDKPQFRPYFFEAKAVAPGDPNAETIYAIAEVRLDLMDSMLANMEARDWSEDETAGWRSTFRDAFAMSPVLCEVLSKTSAHFALLKKPADAGCEQLELEQGGQRKPVRSRASARRQAKE